MVRSHSPASRRVSSSGKTEQGTSGDAAAKHNSPRRSVSKNRVPCDAWGVPLREEVAPWWHPEGPLGHVVLIFAVPVFVVFMHFLMIRFHFRMDELWKCYELGVENCVAVYDLHWHKGWFVETFWPTWSVTIALLSWVALQVILYSGLWFLGAMFFKQEKKSCVH
jgi:hypothetical protein